MATRVTCRKGDLKDFVVVIPGGIDARYTEAKFQVRAEWDETLPLLMGVDETDGITITHSTTDDTGATVGEVLVTLGADVTEALPVFKRSIDVAAQLRLYDPTNAADRRSYQIPFTIMADVIDD